MCLRNMSSEESVDGTVFSTFSRREKLVWIGDQWCTYNSSTPDEMGLQCLQKIKANVSKIERACPHVTADSIKLLKYKVNRDDTNRVILYEAKVRVQGVILSVRINSKGHMTVTPPSDINTHPDRTTKHQVPESFLRQIESITIAIPPGKDWTKYDDSKPVGEEVLTFIEVYRTKIQLTLSIEDFDPQLLWYRKISKAADDDRIVSCEAIIKANPKDSNNYYVVISKSNQEDNPEGNLTIKLIVTPHTHANTVHTENQGTLFLSVRENILTTNVF